MSGASSSCWGHIERLNKPYGDSQGFLSDWWHRTVAFRLATRREVPCFQSAGSIGGLNYPGASPQPEHMRHLRTDVQNGPTGKNERKNKSYPQLAVPRATISDLQRRVEPLSR